MSEAMSAPSYGSSMNMGAPMTSSPEVVTSASPVEHISQPETEISQPISETPVSDQGERTAGNIVAFYSNPNNTVRSTFQELADNGFKNINAQDEEDQTPDPIEEQHEQDRARFIAGRNEAVEEELLDHPETVVVEDEAETAINNPLYKQKLGEVLAEQDATEPIDLEKVKKEALARYHEELREVQANPLNLEKLDPAAAQKITQLEHEVASHKDLIEAMSLNNEEMKKKFEEILLMLALKQAELAALLTKYQETDDEEEKKSLLEQALDFLDLIVKVAMQALIDPDKAQDKMNDGVKDGIEGEDEEKIKPITMREGIAYRMRENQQEIDQVKADYKASQPSGEGQMAEAA